MSLPFEAAPRPCAKEERNRHGVRATDKRQAVQKLPLIPPDSFPALSVIITTFPPELSSVPAIFDLLCNSVIDVSSVGWGFVFLYPKFLLLGFAKGAGAIRIANDAGHSNFYTVGLSNCISFLHFSGRKLAREGCKVGEIDRPRP